MNRHTYIPQILYDIDTQTCPLAVQHFTDPSFTIKAISGIYRGQGWSPGMWKLTNIPGIWELAPCSWLLLSTSKVLHMLE